MSGTSCWKSGSVGDVVLLEELYCWNSRTVTGTSCWKSGSVGEVVLHVRSAGLSGGTCRSVEKASGRECVKLVAG